MELRGNNSKSKNARVLFLGHATSPYKNNPLQFICRIYSEYILVKLENVFVIHYAPNHMPDPKGECSLKENNSELHYGMRSKVNQFIYTLVCNYMPNIRILAIAVLQIFR